MMKTETYFIDKGDSKEENILRVERNGELYDIASFECDETEGENTMEFIVKSCNSYRALLREVENLKMWKEDAISVSPPVQEIGNEMGLKLGETIHDKILPYIRSLKEQQKSTAEALKKSVEWLKDLGAKDNAGQLSKLASIIAKAENK